MECMHDLFIGVSDVRLLSEVASHSACLEVSGKLAVIWSLTASLPSVPTGNSPLIWQVLFVLQSRPMYQPMSGKIHLSKHKNVFASHIIPRHQNVAGFLYSLARKTRIFTQSQSTWLLMTWLNKGLWLEQRLYWPISPNVSAFGKPVLS